MPSCFCCRRRRNKNEDADESFHSVVVADEPQKKVEMSKSGDGYDNADGDAVMRMRNQKTTKRQDEVNDEFFSANFDSNFDNNTDQTKLDGPLTKNEFNAESESDTEQTKLDGNELSTNNNIFFERDPFSEEESESTNMPKTESKEQIVGSAELGPRLLSVRFEDFSLSTSQSAQLEVTNKVEFNTFGKTHEVTKLSESDETTYNDRYDLLPSITRKSADQPAQEKEGKDGENIVKKTQILSIKDDYDAESIFDGVESDVDEMEQSTNAALQSVLPGMQGNSTDTEVDNILNPEDKERYQRACQLLHKLLAKKEHALTQPEQAFLNNLIMPTCNDIDTSSVVDIETASSVLDDDPLFQIPVPDTKLNKSSPMAGHRRRNRYKNRVELAVTKADDVEVSDLTKNRDSNKSLYTMQSSLASSLASVVEKSLSDDTLPFVDNGIVPDLVDALERKQEREDCEDDKLVRFDGWAGYNQEQLHPMEDDDDRPQLLILGTSAGDESSKPHVLSPPLMEALQGFVPLAVSQQNFWMKFSMIRDGASIDTLMGKIRASAYTIIAIETLDGDVFGSFTATPWRKQTGYFGNGEAFLWCLKNPRILPQRLVSSQIDSILEVYPYTNSDEMIQLYTHDKFVVGGGEWKKSECPYPKESPGVGLLVDSELYRGTSASCSTFANPTLCKHSDIPNTFEVSNMEAWTFTPCLSASEAESLELRKLFVEKNRY